ncbi:MAG: excinuclease ABC subunit A [Bradymonadia bacterium]|jgi:excinuclease ABC subunit A
MNARESRHGSDWLIVKGSRVHNLRGVDVRIPKRKFIVFTGVSGSGKSSLAFDTLFAEGQRRYVESLSVYARQFLGKMEKPDVDEIIGLSPTVSIEQKTISHNPRSTVGTITEVYDHLRVLFAQLGVQHCYKCGDPVGSSDAARIVRSLSALAPKTRFMLLAPMVRNRKGEFRDLFEKLRREGFTRVRVDGEMLHLDEVDKLRKTYRHDIDVVVDRLVAKPGIESRLRDAVETGLGIGEERLVLLIDSGPEAGIERLFSTRNYCVSCSISYPLLTHQSFSFNSPMGMCPSCRGLGTRAAMDPDKVVPDPSMTIAAGCFEPLRRRLTKAERWNWRLLEAFTTAKGISRKTPWEELPNEERELLLHGADEAELLEVKGRKNRVRVQFEGVLPHLHKRLVEADTEAKTERLSKYLFETPCGDCDGTRLRKESAAVRFSDMALPDVAGTSIDEAVTRFQAIELTGEDLLVGEELVAEVSSRLRFLQEVGLGYLTLNRGGPTLSGGEAQRIRLARQIGSDLTGVLYVLDEPSIGLHPRDNIRLLGTLARLRDGGNTVLVVEHDQETIEAADWVVDFGPGAGMHGGEVTFEGPVADLATAKSSITADYVSGRRKIEIPAKRRKLGKKAVKIVGARANNLRDVTVSFPCGVLTCVTGVSGAGKSTLVNEILYPAVANHLYKEIRDIAVHRKITGLDHHDKVVRIDQKPIGRSPRSNPATYTKVFDEIRKIFSSLPEAKIYGYKPGRFSFNVAGGRCEACSGSGLLRIEMHFMADVFVQCEQCRGKRFNDATLRVKYRSSNVSDVLNMTFEDAYELFEAYPKIARVLKTVVDVGLGYIRLGQPSPTLSGGEAQRMKLSRELAKVATGETLYILDEPSTGLHFEDIQKLMTVLQTLVDAGNTVLVIEHNLDIVKCADHVIDLGPEGGSGGGFVIAEGTPEQVAQVAESHTGTYLCAVLP